MTSFRQQMWQGTIILVSSWTMVTGLDWFSPLILPENPDPDSEKERKRLVALQNARNRSLRSNSGLAFFSHFAYPLTWGLQNFFSYFQRDALFAKESLFKVHKIRSNQGLAGNFEVWILKLISTSSVVLLKWIVSWTFCIVNDVPTTSNPGVRNIHTVDKG